MGNGNVFGGFVVPGKDKSYHLRRLLVKPVTETTEISYENNNFEFFDTEFSIRPLQDENSYWYFNNGVLVLDQNNSVKDDILITEKFLWKLLLHSTQKETSIF
ncbi:MAG: hypothetical protein JXR64_03290 [Spirochaetales bacterium]|nr:hypothetical protein [Spirochaetales bacterium]